MMLQAEQILHERYQLKQELGNKAGRQTWLAVDLATPTKERVIVKLLPFNPQIHWDDLKLFEWEAQVLKHLNHLRIPKYRDYFYTEPSNSGDLPWFCLVQDYILGYSLPQLLKKGKRFTEAEAKQIAIQLLNILIYLHELSPPVLHRDIKPSNIIWEKNRQVYLVDFGAVQEKAKAEGATFTIVGTGGYAPPEQLWGRAVPASDLYALGATLIHLLTGTAPVDLPQHEMRLQFREQVSLSPSFAYWLEALIDPAPELRFSNAREALLALQANTSPISPLEITNTGSQETTQKGCRSAIAINIAVLQYVFLFLFVLWASNFRPTKRKPMEGRQNIGAMNRAQQAYFLEYQQFTEDLQQLGTGIKNPSTNYEYSIRATPLAVFNYATARTKDIKNSVGAVFLKVDNEQTSALSTVEIICETETPFNWLPNWAKVPQAPPPAAPPIVQGNVIKCGLNTKSVSFRNEAERSVLDKDSALAYNSLNDATMGRHDQAIKKVQTIKNDFLKARALATIAIKLAEQGQYDKALEVTKTIQEGSSKQMALDAIAHVRH